MTLTRQDLADVAAELDAQLDLAGAEYRPRYNVAPTDPHWIVLLRGGRLLTPARWGLVTSRNPAVINVRAETAARRFRQAFEQRRCIVPADGFYEWTGPAGKRRPIWFHSADGRLLAFAGFYEASPDGSMAFTILTTDPSEEVARVHDRMPVVLPPDAIDAWLEKGAKELLVPAPAGFLVGTPANPRVNSVANDDPECLVPPPDAEKGQLDLF
jgi:putative SOS response-associated peptidase YedK